MRKVQRAICWIRRDLRLTDHTALNAALSSAESVVVAFVFDPDILRELPQKADRRVTYILRALQEIDRQLRERGSCLLVRYGRPEVDIPHLAKALGAQLVTTNKDYEPQAKSRDLAVGKALREQGVLFDSFKDQVVFEGSEIRNQKGEPYRVFTPWAKAWTQALKPEHFASRTTPLRNLVAKQELEKLSHPLTAKALGFSETALWIDAGEAAARKLLHSFDPITYEKLRDFPASHGTSGLSTHLRFGAISVRECVRYALDHPTGETWLKELIWREFYQMILDQFPHVAEGSFKREFDQIQWPGKESHFQAWQEGRTGFPLVDAAMRHFNETGWMHNRLRMVVASFLVKDLLIDWRKGERHFAHHLLDFDLASNNGGWQWCASTGCDAQPWFRIFNPWTQSKKFDPKGLYIQRHVPEFRGARDLHRPGNFPKNYPEPIVDHATQRKLVLNLFSKVK